VFDDVLRALKDRALAPLARALGTAISPTTVSLLSFAAGLAAALLLVRRSYLAALASWWLSRLLDGLDGTLARVQGRSSDLGGYLDLLLDFFVYALVPIGLVVGAPSAASLYALGFLLGAFYVNAASWMYLAAILERRGKGAVTSGQATTVATPPGLIAGTETIVFYTLFMLWPERAPALFAVMGALVVVGVGQRIVWAVRHL
jgi:phosphatidylglycerophosphate synthase